MDRQVVRKHKEPSSRTGICTLAMCSLVLGAFGCSSMVIPFEGDVPVFGMIASLVAVGAGPAALWKIRRAAGALRGRGLAMAGMVMGCLGIACLFLPIREPQSVKRERARRISCASNLNQIGLSCHEYAADNGGLFPDNLSRLYPEYMSTLDIFICPSSNDKVQSLERIEQDGSYVYVHGVSANNPEDTLLVYDKPTSHHPYDNPGRNELYLDGNVEWRPDDTEH